MPAIEHSEFIGQDAQLQRLADELRPIGRGLKKAGLVLINGPTGLGKRTLVRRAWQRLDNSECPRLMIYVDGDASTPLPERLLASMWSNRGFLDQASTQMKEAFQGFLELGAMESDELPPLDAQLERWKDLLAFHFTENPRNARELQLILVFCCFEQLPHSQRHQLLGLIPTTDAVDTRVLVTCSTALDPGDRSALESLQGEPLNIALPPLTPEEVQAWLAMREAPADLAPKVYHQSGGVPGRMEAALAEALQAEAEQTQLDTAAELLNSLSQSESLDLSLAAFLPELSLETLPALYDEKKAREIMQITHHLPTSVLLRRGEVWVLHETARHSLQVWLQHKDPELYRTGRSIQEQFGRIASRIPEGTHRRMLARLLNFKHFNSQLLKEILGREADSITHFCTAECPYLESTGSNLRLRPDIRKLMEAYVELMRVRLPEGEQETIIAAWHRDRQAAEEAAKLAEAQLQEQARGLEALQTQIRQLSAEIAAETEALQRLHRKSQTRAPQAPRIRKGGAGSIALQVLGTAVLYFSILLSNRVSLLYAGIGIGLILAGLFLQGRRSLPSRSVQPPPPAPVDGSKHEKNIHFLNLKKNHLETRFALIHLNVSKQKETIKAFDRLVREPYC